MGRIGYLGPEGSYTSLAAEKLCPNDERRAYANFRLVMNAVVTGECDGVVAPIENSLNGGVLQNIDLLQSTEGVYASEECTVDIDHRLATFAGADCAKITRIFSHRQALDQCAAYLSEHYPFAELIATPSTAASLGMMRLPTDAGIVGAHTVKAGVVLSERNIADEKCNITHFLLIRRGEVAPDAHSRKVYFCVTCRHEPGALLRILEPLAEGGLNMTKIGSRPIKERPGEYRFFIEIEGDYAADPVKRTLEKVRAAANSWKLLGAY